MLYHITHEPSGVLLFSAKWSRCATIFQELDWIKSILGVDDHDGLVIVGSGTRFTIGYDCNGKLSCMYDGKHFYTFVENAYSYVMPDTKNGILTRVFSNLELTEMLGEDINARL